MLAIFFVEDASENGISGAYLLVHRGAGAGAATKLVIGVVRAVEARSML